MRYPALVENNSTNAWLWADPAQEHTMACSFSTLIFVDYFIFHPALCIKTLSRNNNARKKIEGTGKVD